ncbi:uncharacterized protein BDV17DRAFT_225141 [Aspergillus undulatus]|uniref:uncharacterized protein n=1 Tax=Aspergillus undulatus TaxID=1810928 RepID=UPI003CCCB633
MRQSLYNMPPRPSRPRQTLRPSTGHGRQASLMVIFVTLVSIADVVSCIIRLAETALDVYDLLRGAQDSGTGAGVFRRWGILSILVGLYYLSAARISWIACEVVFRKHVRPWAWENRAFGYWAGLVQVMGLTGEGSDVVSAWFRCVCVSGLRLI